MVLLQKEFLSCSLYSSACSLILGAIVGSFLNCLIYRLPRGFSLITPARSFCPTCNRSLPWWENIPLLSWIYLRGRCHGCQMPISFRYFLVEAITALLFWYCSVRLGFPLAIAGWLFIALLIVATFIDFEQMIIPDVITLGGMASGIAASFLLPTLMGTTSHTAAFFFSLGSAALGYALLWGTLELGKMAFGRRKIHWKQPCLLELFQKEGLFFLRLEEEDIALQELFFRPSDIIMVQADELEIAGSHFTAVVLKITEHDISVTSGEKRSWSLQEVVPLRARITEITLPREAMGFGDVKFLACIGAFLGVKGMLFSLFAGSIVGAVAGSLLLLFTRGRVGRCIPFGPYLAFGALIWFLKLWFF